MFMMKAPVSRFHVVDLDDTSNVKLALTSLGYYDDSENGFSPYTDNQLFSSIQAFQKDNGLKVDGVINPEGQTHAKIKEDLQKNKRSGNTFLDFKRNFDLMKEADTIGADKYFHCIANYEAANRGWLGKVGANLMSGIREITGAPKEILRDGLSERLNDIEKDMEANRHGREAARSEKYASAKEACAIFRPKGLNEKY